LVALIIAAKHNAKDEECLNSIKQVVDSYNSDCEKQEQVKKFRVIHDEWNTENGLLNPDLSLNRRALYEKYKEILEELYNAF
jgi:long-chain acyl-CoA synthetase